MTTATTTPIEEVRLSSLRWDSTRTDYEMVTALAEDLRRYRQQTPIVVERSTGRVLKGAKRCEAAARLKWETIRAVFV